MLRRGLLQNAAFKAFMGIKSAVSALVVNNLSKLLEGLIRIARDLRRIDVDAENV